MRHGKVDGCAVGCVEEQYLRRRHMQNVRQGGGVGGQGLLQPAGKQRRYRQAVAQRRDQYGAHQRAVARVERPVLRMTMFIVGQPVERCMRVDDGGQQPRRRLARGKAGDIAVRPLVSRRRASPSLRYVHDHGPLGPVGLRPHGLDLG